MTGESADYVFPLALRDSMDCSHCDHGIDERAEYFELHHQAGSDAVLQHIFCSPECLREQVFE